MSLGDIKNKLYKKDTDVDLASHDESKYDPKIASGTFISGDPKKDLWAEKQLDLDEGHKRKAIKTGAYVLGGIIGFILLLVIIFFVNKSLFNSSRVVVKINGPAQAKSGELVSYEISYANNNVKGIKNAVLEITYPDNFEPEGNNNFKPVDETFGTYDLGKISSYDKGKIIFTGRMFSPRGALIYLKANLVYNSGSFSSKLESQNQLGINVVSSPIVLEVMAPQKVASGNEVNYVITYKNSGDQDFENIIIRADYPEGFTFANSEPKGVESNNNWYIGHLSAGQEGKIVVSGKLEGDFDSTKVFIAHTGILDNGTYVSYNEEKTQTNIASAPFKITQTVNGLSELSVNPGDTLSFDIAYSNIGSAGLRNTIITEKIDSPVLDWESLVLEKGSFDSSKKTITWKASDFSKLANLAPGAGGAVKFSIKVKDIIPVSTSNDKNFLISSLAQIDSPDVQTPVDSNKIISGNRMDIKLNSKVVLTTKGYYFDKVIPNSGPVPPKVDQETTYSIHFSILNVSNDIANAQLQSVLPTGVSFTGNISPGDAAIKYNDRTNLLTWDIGNIPAGTGILNAAREAVIQVKIRPTVDLIDKNVTLLNAPVLTATDTFSGNNINVSSDNKTTDLTEDKELHFRSEVTP